MSAAFRSPSPSAADAVDPAIDFCNLSVRLDRPSDHFRTTNPYEPPPRRRRLTPHQIASRFINDPVTTTLSSFSRVAHWALATHEEYDNVIDMITSRTEVPHNDPLPSFRPPPPALPAIPCSVPQFRVDPLTALEFDDLGDKPVPEILNRVFRGGIADNDLRQRLWPLILGLTDDWKVCDWEQREKLFDHYDQQWRSIRPDQETRFTAYRERKSIVERDVVRCDRTHPFYSGTSDKLEQLRILLMSYIMHDFDTGYVQGMTDLASPLLFVYGGDVKKAFWTFAQVMCLFKNNFEMSQKTISYQLEMLFKLIRLTDPCFAQFLVSQESDNCYFAFRWIICLFKREFMKSKTDDYQDCLLVWETIWAATAITNHRKKTSAQEKESNANADGAAAGPAVDATIRPDAAAEKDCGSESPKSESGSEHLSDAQLFVLCICLSIIRRERDLIMAQRFDACETLKHFNTLSLNASLKDILLHASTIWFWLKNDGGQEQLYFSDPVDEKTKHDSAIDDFDLLNDEFTVLNTMNV